MSRKNVDVVVRCSSEGQKVPLYIIWEDGRKFDIDRITDVRKAASLKAGGCGLRYTCSIRNKSIYLFEEQDTWFVE
jgi:hypothetical protein